MHNGLREDGLGVCETYSSNLDVYGDFWSECGKENSISDVGLYYEDMGVCTSVLTEMQKLGQLVVNDAALISLLSLNAI